MCIISFYWFWFAWWSSILLKAYRLEPLIYEHYAEIPPVRINEITKQNANSQDENRKEGIASVWLKSWFGNTQKPGQQTTEYHGNDNVDLPKSQMEKVDDILKEKKGKNHSGNVFAVLRGIQYCGGYH